MPLIAIIVPVYLRNWKRLLIWHIIVSVFITYFFSLIDSSEGNPAGAGGAAMYAYFLLILHLFSSACKGMSIYLENERRMKMFPIYAIIAILSYDAITIVIFLIGGALFY